MKRVFIIQRITGHYRESFFNNLARELKKNGILLTVLYGQPYKNENNIGNVTINNSRKIKNYYFNIFRKQLVFQNVFLKLKHADLIIIQQGRKIISNYLLLFFYEFIFRKKLGIWGNSKQELNSFLNDNFKSDIWWKLFNSVDCWFAYNDLTKKIVEAAGFSSSKITSIENSIDTRKEKDIYNSISNEEIIKIKNEYNIVENDIVGIFCSRLYSDKRIDFLLQTLDGVKRHLPYFKFFVIGEGEESDKIKKYTLNNSEWFFWVGAKYGKEKIDFFKIADIQLLPGAVGLHIIDSFALETPIITVQSSTHGVEIDYLKNYENGIISENTLEAYVNDIITVCKTPELLNKLKKGCNESAHIYTVENMVSNFANGVIKCLNE